jgi:hypothetical protein
MRGSGRVARLACACIALAATSCSPPLDVDGARAHARVVRQVEMGPRIPGTPGHAVMIEWLAAELTRLGGRVERQTFVDSAGDRRLDLVNVIGRFGPEAGRRIVLSAHWDTRPWSDEEPDTALRSVPVPGANDGGSGVAVLLEVAELMSRRPPPVGVDLVFFDGEDQGPKSRPQQYCLGSRAYAARLSEPRPVAAFNFDMVGDRDLSISPEVQSTRRAANLVGIVLEAARATSARHFHSEPRHAVLDDHIPLLEAGVPAVDIIDFDYPAWHTPRDLPDQVSPESLAEVARVAAWIVYRSALSAPSR